MRVVRVVVAVLVGSVVVAGCSGDDEDSPEVQAGRSAAAFVQAWQAGKPTGNADADAQIKELTAKLNVVGTAVDAPARASCNEAEDACEVKAGVALTLKGIGEWTYDTTLAVAKSEADEWVVDWEPGTFHPQLTAETSLSRTRELAPRAQILGANDRELTADTPVMRIGVVKKKVKDTTYAQLEQLLDIDAAALRTSVDAAEADWFVPVLTLREREFRPLADRLLKVPGISVDGDEWSLTKSSSWARALVGTVGPASKETLEQAGPLAASTDVVGVSGLQLAFQEQLAGRPGGTVDLVDAESGAKVKNLWTLEAVPGKPVTTTIDPDVQDAAERAVQQQSKKTALVAMRIGTGEILASAVGPKIQSYNTAFVGKYPPGSTFKLVSAATLLDAGAVSSDTKVACPTTTTVDGKSFKNYDDFASISADPTFAEDIAASCNTAVVSQADKIDASALADMAGRLGLGMEWKLGVEAFSGSVPAADGDTDRAASMIGQGRVLASPLAMAMVPAAVASGQPATPRLLSAAAKPPELRKLPADLVDPLRSMMRLTVTDGTASSLDLAGDPVFAKTGTAEYDSDDPSKTHAWIIGYRRDVAFAVLVEEGESGSHDAAPVVRTFLESLP
ncbi:MAG: penicillin-binding transpeptidase domain-containing protein [Nocardioidaceae bacterium]